MKILLLLIMVLSVSACAGKMTPLETTIVGASGAGLASQNAKVAFTDGLEYETIQEKSRAERSYQISNDLHYVSSVLSRLSKKAAKKVKKSWDDFWYLLKTEYKCTLSDYSAIKESLMADSLNVLWDIKVKW